jgi:hypothetical protein
VGSPVNKNHRLSEEPFDYQITKDRRVIIFWHNKQVKTLRGKEAEKLIATLDELDEPGVQLALAKVTGNFKRGNERQLNSH